MQAAMMPPSRADQLSPISPVSSEWSGVNNYHQLPRGNEGPYAPLPYNPSAGDFGPPPPRPMQSFRPPPNPSMNTGPLPFDPMYQRRPSESGSRESSRAGSIAASRSSDGTISDEQSRKYRKRAEAELFKHYTVLKGFLKGGAYAPPRPNKARDKLLRLSPVQFHELSTDVFDELQRRQASAPIPGRPPRQMNVPPSLQARPDFHEKRNQARQKLSSLPTSRFRDLSTDVFCELERRFPQFARPDGPRRDPRGPPPNGYPPMPRSQSYGISGGPGPGNMPRQGSANSLSPVDQPPLLADYGRPMAKQFQSNMITPNKSMMVEDEDDAQGMDSRYDRSSDAFGLESSLTSPRSDRDTSATSRSGGSSNFNSKPNEPALAELQAKVTALEANVEARDEELRQLKAQGQGWAITKQDLDKRLEEAENLNKALHEEIEKLRGEEPQYGGESDIWQTRYLELEQEHGALQDQLSQQRQLTNDVGRQGQAYLEEMRAMAESGGGSLERQDKLQSEVHRLEDEVKEWKSRYVKSKAQLRSVRASSLGLSVARPDVNRQAAGLQDREGLVKDIHVTRFQISIDELLHIARSDHPGAVLDHMKTVVLAVRGITADIDAAGSGDKEDEGAKRRAKLKSKISATANNLITASKNFAASSGLSPVSLVDAAASHLTAAVVDLLHAVKIRPTPAGELGEDEDTSLEPLQSNGYFNIASTLRRRSAVESVYSALSSPSEAKNASTRTASSLHRRTGSNYANGPGLGIKSGYGTSQEEADLEDLKMYLEDQTDGLVQSITFLVDSIRKSDSIPTIQNHISTISGTIENIVNSVDRTANEPSSYQMTLKEKSHPILAVLQDCREQLSRAGDDAAASGRQSDDRDFAPNLPPLAFKVARETKELVSRIMAVEARPAGEDDFH